MGKLTISKVFDFEAAHGLTKVPITHKCNVNYGCLKSNDKTKFRGHHGHSYKVKVFLSCKDIELNTYDFVQDFRELDFVKKYIDDNLDHRNLNDVFPNMETTSENLAKFLYYEFKKTAPLIVAVEISETAKSNCRYEE
jgi:6-pyruvoyltetrahydropterin/6-carboxytetrahydropterin synthase